MVAKKKLSEEHWAAIRQIWEYDPGEPTYNEAAARAGEKFGFLPPSKTTIDSRAKKEGWQRRGSMTGVNAAAQRKADASPSAKAAAEGSSDADRTGSDGVAANFSDASDAGKAQATREESEDLRAKVIDRHRNEWGQVAALRQEAVKARHHPKLNPAGDDGAAKEKARIAKLIAEVTALQQAGERKAWGLDVVVDPDQLRNLSDADLQAIAEGKAPGGR